MELKLERARAEAEESKAKWYNAQRQVYELENCYNANKTKALLGKWYLIEWSTSAQGLFYAESAMDIDDLIQGPEWTIDMESGDSKTYTFYLDPHSHRFVKELTNQDYSCRKVVTRIDTDTAREILLNAKNELSKKIDDMFERTAKN